MFRKMRGKEQIVLVLILLFIIVQLSCNRNRPVKSNAVSVSSGSTDRFESFNSRFVKPRNVDVWLPPGYTDTNRYAVLYMHDGQMLFDSSATWNGQDWGVDDIAGRLIESGEIKPVIIVGIWNTGESRHSEYFPQKPFEELPPRYRDSLINLVYRPDGRDLFSEEVQSDQYLRFLVEELKPCIDEQYSTFPDRQNTFIAGSSMGGLISLYAICEYPDVFGGAACLSTHWPGIFDTVNNPIPGELMKYLEKKLPDPATHKLYFDFGTETLDALYEPYQLEADKIVSAHQYDGTNWMTRKFEGHNHSEVFWGKRLHIPLTFLLKPESMKNLTPKVTGIGGIFFRAKNPDEIKKWYGDNLGLAIGPYGSPFEFRNAHRPNEVNYLNWNAFDENTEYFNPSQKEFMINYRVQNIEGLVQKLKNNGVIILDDIEKYEYGKFVHILDPEGNKIELWEPVDSVLSKLGETTTK